MSDLLLIKQLQQQHASTFEKVYKEHFPTMVGVGVNYLHNEDQAKEVAQEVFAKIWETPEKLNGVKSIKAYLVIATKNRCMNEIRNHRTQSGHQEIILKQTQHFNVGMDAMEFQDLETQVAKSISELPERKWWSSRQREFHPKPLTEPYVKVTPYTALAISNLSWQ